MKKVVCGLMSILILMTSMCVLASASDANTNTYDYEIYGTKYTIEIDDSAVSVEKQEAIAEKLVGIENQSTNNTYGLGCTLFGHDYAYTTATVIEHKVRTYAPRCKKMIYDVTYCEDCDYTEQTLVGTAYIDCCPEE